MRKTYNTTLNTNLHIHVHMPLHHDATASMSLGSLVAGDRVRVVHRHDRRPRLRRARRKQQCIGAASQARGSDCSRSTRTLSLSLSLSAKKPSLCQPAGLRNKRVTKSFPFPSFSKDCLSVRRSMHAQRCCSSRAAACATFGGRVAAGLE